MFKGNSYFFSSEFGLKVTWEIHLSIKGIGISNLTGVCLELLMPNSSSKRDPADSTAQLSEESDATFFLILISSSDWSFV